MKTLISIDALAHGLEDGGAQVFTNFPGYMSHVLFTSLGGKYTSINEKIAYEIAWGSSFAGKRSVVTFKNVGLSDAADPFINSQLVGVNAGLVVVVFDDVFVEGSQSRQDSRHYYSFFKGLWFEPYSLQNAYDTAREAFVLSEKFKLPVVIRITSQLVHMQDTYKRKKKITLSKKVKIHNEQFVVHPVHAAYQRKILAIKERKIQDYVNSLYEKKIKIVPKENKIVLSFGCNKEEEKQYVKAGTRIIHLYTYPIPVSLYSDVRSIKKVVVVEQGTNFAYKQIVSQNEAVKLKSLTGFIPDKSKGYIISSSYEKLFLALKGVGPSYVVGDLGEYTKDTLNSVNACLCFGSSISVAIGGLLGGSKKIVSIIGDAAYLHSGKNSIAEALVRKLPACIIVICNGGSQGTGGQEIPGDLYYQPKDVQKNIVDYRKTSKVDFMRIFRTMLDSDCVSVLYVKM